MKSKLIGVVVTLLCASFSAAAQESAAPQGWDWKIAPYLWAAGIDGDAALGPISRPVNVSFSDLVDVLAGAALVHVEASHAEHTVFADLVWMSLEPDDEIATVGGTAKAKFDTTIVEAGYIHELSRVGVKVGVRYWDLELELDPALLAAVKRDDSWTDAFVGIRHQRPIGEKWRMTTDVDVGGGGSSFAYGVQLVFARKFKSGNAFVTGFKALGIDYSNASVKGIPFKVDTVFMGATVGYLFD